MFDHTTNSASRGSIRTVDPDEAARRITESISRLFFSPENQVRFHGAADELKISPPMLKALLDLTPGEGRPMRELAGAWGCDASFVTVTCDGLEARGMIERRVSDRDRRVKMVELTPAGVEAQAWAGREVFGPRAGFAALTPAEQRTVATLLGKMADAQDVHDRAISDDPKVRGMVRQMSAQRTREFRGAAAAGRHEPWTAQLEAHRRELADLKDELARMRDDLKAQLRQPVEHAKAAKADVKARVKAAAKDRSRRPSR
jgi:MarR family transcriptional regulator, organic hydroperoxide resistance regulator